MSNLRRPTFTGVEAIMKGFETLQADGLVYAVFYTDRDIAFQCVIQDKKNQEDMMRSNLEALEEAGNCELLYLRFYDVDKVKGYIEPKDKFVSITPIQVVEYPENRMSGQESGTPAHRPAGMSREAFDMWLQLRDLPRTIEDKIGAALAERFPDDDEEEPDPEIPQPTALDQAERINGIINGLMQNPLVVQILTGLAGMMNRTPAAAVQIPSRIGMVEPETLPPPAGIRLTQNEDLMNDALNRLSYHIELGSSLDKLAKIAETDPAKFKMLHTMLMSM